MLVSSVSVRSYLGAGVAALSVGAIALTPAQPLPNVAVHLPEPVVAHAVQLAAFDVVTPWLTVFNDATLNLSALSNSALGPNKSNAGDGKTVGALWPTLQQIGANQLKFATELPDIGGIIKQVLDNTKAAFAAPFQADKTTLSSSHSLAYSLLPQILPDVPQSLVDLTTTSMSGVLLGTIGPVLGPALALGQSITDIIAALKASDWSGALNAALNIPAKMTGAFLNGGPVLDLTWLAPILNLPPAVKTIGLTMGGLLSPGGSAFNTIDGDIIVNIDGVGAGPMGSMMGIGWEIASALGWARNGNPLHPGIPVPGAATAPQLAVPAAAVESAAPAVPHTQAPLPAAAEVAPKQVEGAAQAPLQNSAPADSPAPVADAPDLTGGNAPAAADVPAPAEAPAPRAGSARQQATSSDNGDGAGHSSHPGARVKHAG